jgi:hypothetical protein
MATRYTSVIGSLRDRALHIEQIVAAEYCDGNVDAADLALAELHLCSNRRDDQIARVVASRILTEGSRS